MTQSTALLQFRQLGQADYLSTWEAMKRFTQHRNADTVDEVWLLEHPPLFTLGRSADVTQLHSPNHIPHIPVDRGGQITYHGPGQLLLYLLFDLKRARLGVKQLVSTLEQAVIQFLTRHQISAHTQTLSPGVYVEGQKIAAVGLRIRRGCSYHGLSLNVDMDLDPFLQIDPCGYPGLATTQLSAHGVMLSPTEVGLELARHLATSLGRSLQAAEPITP